MALKGKPIAVGTTDTDLYTCPSTIEASVHGLVFANGTGSSATITVKVYVQSTAATTTIITGQAVAANTAFTWPKPINLNAGDKIIASASTGSAIVCLYSAYEGSAAPVAVGFTPRGAWSSGASYVTNDVVSYTNGSSYLAIQASTNQQPDTQTAYWLLLAAKGDTGSGDVTGPSSSVDNEIALFNSTTGKIIKRATTTGMLRATSGVIAAATAGTDFVAPGGALGTPSSGTLSGCTVDGTNEVGFKNIPQNSQSAAYTLVLADSGKHILHPSADTTARTFTIPANGSVAFPVGTAITFVNQNGAGTVTIAITTDTMRLAGTGTTGSRTLAANGVATAIKITSTEWIISGTGLT
jgi:hypothetical protein